jgi:type IV secretory pathway VirB3-like protein
MGVPREFFGNNVGVLGFMTFAAKMKYFFVVSLVLHVVFIGITKRDSLALKILIRYFRHSFRYEPWPMKSKRTKTLRPKGWGKEEVF